jgi:hypothetical protein
MITLTAGKLLGSGDLNIIIRDEGGSTYAPFAVSYSIFSLDPLTQIQTLVSTPNSIPASPSVGVYNVAMSIPTLWDGRYKLVWYVQRNYDSSIDQVFEDFQVIPFAASSPTSSFEAPSVFIARMNAVSLKTAEMIMQVRELLSDTNPDRNYHFRPPTSGKTVAGFTSRVGFIWTDQTIIRMLQVSISQINVANPMALYNYTLDTILPDWANAAAVGAAAKCLTAEGARWAADEFGYSLNGVSLDLNKSQTYLGLASAYATEFKEWIPALTANRPQSVGLRQNRWLLG